MIAKLKSADFIRNYYRNNGVPENEILTNNECKDEIHRGPYKFIELPEHEIKNMYAYWGNLGDMKWYFYENERSSKYNLQVPEFALASIKDKLDKILEKE